MSAALEFDRIDAERRAELEKKLADLRQRRDDAARLESEASARLVDAGESDEARERLTAEVRDAQTMRQALDRRIAELGRELRGEFYRSRVADRDQILSRIDAEKAALDAKKEEHRSQLFARGRELAERMRDLMSELAAMDAAEEDKYRGLRSLALYLAPRLTDRELDASIGRAPDYSGKVHCVIGGVREVVSTMSVETVRRTRDLTGRLDRV